ncbi:unnamed protein product, partial [marine sediment metagenome]
MNDETLERIQGRQIDHLAAIDVRAEANPRPEHHIGLARAIATVIAKPCADDQIVKAIAVDIAGGRDADACLVSIEIALDDKTL